MAVALLDEALAVGLLGQGPGPDRARVGAEAHGRALLGDALLVGHEVDHGIGGLGVELRGARARHSADVARELADGHLQAQADAEVGHLACAGAPDRLDLALDAAQAKAPGHEDAVGVAELGLDVLLAERLAVDQADVHVPAEEHAGVVQRLDDGEVGVGQLGVLAHHADAGDVGAPVGGVHRLREGVPALHVALARLQPQPLADLDVKALLGEMSRHVVDRGQVGVLEDVVGRHVAEARDLGAQAGAHLAVRAADDEVGLQAERAHLAHGVLRGLGLELVGGGDVGHQAHVDEAAVRRALVVSELADGLHEGLALDVADGAAELGDHHVGAGLLLDAPEALLDGVGHVRDDLHGAAEEVAGALAGDEVLVDGARREVGVAREVLVDEALVVPEVEVGLVAVLGHEDLAVLERAHRARVHVEVGVRLLHHDAVAPGLEQAAQRCRGDALAQGRDDAAGNEDVLCHVL